MSRWIDADAIKNKAWKAESEACFYALEDVVSVTDIDEAPSIDIVRCGECKYWRAYETWSVCELWTGDPYEAATTNADDFCSYGSRSEKPNNSTISILEQVEPQTEQWHYDEKDNTWYPYQHKSCSTCKHALGNWDGESNNCGRCCGADRRFYEPKDEQPERMTEEEIDTMLAKVLVGQTDCGWGEPNE